MNANSPNADEYSDFDAVGDANPFPAPQHDYPMIAREGADRSEVIPLLNVFLRGEISAAETYRMALERVVDKKQDADGDVIRLRDIQEEHGRAAQAIRHRIREMGGEASDTSGAWGAWAKLTMGAAKLFGDAAALKALAEGEEHGMKEFRAGLPHLDASSAEMIRNQFIPAQQRHIRVLEQWIAALREH